MQAVQVSRLSELDSAAGADMSVLMRPLVADDVSQLIGKTPLVRLNRVTEGCGATILAKLESLQPGCSVKDRIGLSLIAEAEKRGDIKPGVTTLVEPTSGNTGIALAMIAAARGYACVLVMPDSMSLERRVLIKAYGAKVILTDVKKGFDEVLAVAEKTKAEIGDSAVILDQFSNPDNPKAHADHTGPEIWAQTSGSVDALVAGVGTGGTVSGCGRYLKSVNPSIKVCAVEPEESAVLSGCAKGPHRIQGIGAGFIPNNCDQSVIDRILKVHSDDAMRTAREVTKKEGLLIGISAGAAVHAALELGKEEEMRGKTICVVIASSGERYLSTELFKELMDESKAQTFVTSEP